MNTVLVLLGRVCHGHRNQSHAPIRIHFRHLTKALGESFNVTELQLADLQGYVDRRAKAKGRNDRKLSATTIHKEIVTFRTAWNWAVKMKLVAGRFPNDGLRYPKTTEKPPFMTRAEIDRRIAAGGLSYVPARLSIRGWCRSGRVTWTRKTSRRYRHLWPSVQQEALATVFG